MVKIMVEVLDLLAIATKETKQSRASELNLRITLFLADIGPEKFLKKERRGSDGQCPDLEEHPRNQ